MEHASINDNECLYRQNLLSKVFNSSNDSNKYYLKDNKYKYHTKVTNKKEFIKIKTGVNVKIIPVENIYYFKAEDKYVLVKHTEGEAVVSMSLKRLQGKLRSSFIRIHRNALVSMDMIQGCEVKTGNNGVNTWQVTFKKISEKLVISRGNVPHVKNILGCSY